MTSEQLGQVLQILILVVGCAYGGFQVAVIREKRRAKREESTGETKKQESAAILALANAFSPLISQMQDQTLAIRANTQVTQELVQKIAEGNELESKQRELESKQRASSLEAQIGLAQHLATNTQNLLDLSETFNKVGLELKKTIDDSRSAVTDNSKSLASEIKGAIESQANKVDSVITPLAKQFQEALVALTKALELLTAALEKINDIGANQAEIKKLVEEARSEIKDQLAKPVPAETLPPPAPAPEPPKEVAT